MIKLEAKEGISSQFETNLICVQIKLEPKENKVNFAGLLNIRDIYSRGLIHLIKLMLGKEIYELEVQIKGETCQVQSPDSLLLSNLKKRKHQ